MLTLNILPICEAKGIKQPFPFLIKAGFPNTAAYQIASGHCIQPKLAHVEKLCLILGCMPHDLLQWVPDKGQTKEVPLAALIPKQEVPFNWMDELQKLPLEKLRAMSKVIEQELHKEDGPR
jgi:hypothetical protein